MIQNTKTLKDAAARFRTNYNGYIKKYRWLLSLTVIAGLADMVSTVYFMIEHGPEAEVHPAIRIVCVIFGPIAGPLVGKLCQFAAVIMITIYFRRQAVFIFIPVIILYAWAAWYNVWGCYLYYPRLLKFIDVLF